MPSQNRASQAEPAPDNHLYVGLNHYLLIFKISVLYFIKNLSQLWISFAKTTQSGRTAL